MLLLLVASDQPANSPLITSALLGSMLEAGVCFVVLLSPVCLLEVGGLTVDERVGEE
jgi:hypothetical protein